MQIQGKRTTGLVVLRLVFLAALILVLLSPQISEAVTDRYWNAGDGDWNVDGNWNPVGQPEADDSVYINTSGVSVQYLISTSSVPLNYLEIDASTTGPSLNLTTFQFLEVDEEKIGLSGNGRFTQNNGKHKVNNLYLGFNLGSVGRYELSGAGYVEAGNEYIGYSGTGHFIQDGGTHIISNELGLSIGDQLDGIGIYELKSGSFSAHFEYIGNHGNGSYTQSGGTHSLSGDLWLGKESSAIGTYTMSGSGSLSARNQYIGSKGAGTFTQSGGTNTMRGSLLLGHLSGSGTYDLSGSGSLSVGSLETIGNIGTGTFTQSGGTNTIAKTLVIGDEDSSSGTYELSGSGFLSASYEYIGRFGMGNFTQSGGTNTIFKNFLLGVRAGGSGTYGLSGGNLSAGYEYIGYLGTGIFTQSGGTNTVTSTLTLAANLGSSGTYNLEGGDLSAGTIEANPGGLFHQTGGSWTGTFNQVGGTVDGTLENLAGSTFNYSSGTFSGRLINWGMVNFNADFTAGNGLDQYSATPITLGPGRSITLNGEGLGVGKDGIFNLDGGILWSEITKIGFRGTFTQTGGTHTIHQGLEMGGVKINEGGTYTLSGGDLMADYAVIGGPFAGGTFTQNGGSNTLESSLAVGGFHGTYNLSGSGSLSAPLEVIGVYGVGTFVQSGGTNTVSDELYLGPVGNNHGTYDLSGTGSLSAKNEYIGYFSGTGIFTQRGGTNIVTNKLVLADQDGGSGTYNLAGGSLSVGSIEVNPGGLFNQTGGSWTGTFNQLGGNVTGSLENLAGSTFNYTTGTFNGRLVNWGIFNFNADFTAGNGLAQYSETPITIGDGLTVTLNGEGLEVDQGSSLTLESGNLEAPYNYIGYEGNGTFNHNGGTNTVSGTLYLGYDMNSSGTYDLSSNGSLSVAYEYIGRYGTGSFTQTGGANTLTNLLSLGTRREGTLRGNGTYELIDGSLSSQEEFIGDSGNGTFIQSGGTNFAESLWVGRYRWSIGTYELSGTGTLTAANEYIGGEGTGDFIHTEGTNILSSDGVNIDGDLIIGWDRYSRGTYELSGGSLEADSEIIGYYGTGTFTQSGGSNASEHLSISYERTGRGEYIQSGGTNAIGGYLSVAADYNKIGTYELSGGSLEAEDEIIGSYGYGTFTQSGGSNTVNNRLILNYNYAKYNLSGGNLDAPYELIGNSGPGIFTHSGGTNTVRYIYLGFNKGSSGNYILSDTGSLSAVDEIIGRKGGGWFTQSDGINAINDGLYVGYEYQGFYRLSGGSLEASYDYIGYEGAGIFTHEGGTNTVSNTLFLGYGTKSQGTYRLSGGGSLEAAIEVIGSEGIGSFVQSGGTNSVETLSVASGRSSRGTYELSGGSLLADYETIGLRGGGTFTQTGGINTVSSILTLAAEGGSNGSYNLRDGSLSAGTIYLWTNSLFRQTGGTLNFDFFNQVGGEVQGGLENRGFFNYVQGSFTGRLLNYGEMDFQNDFTAGNGLAQYSVTPITIGAGRSVTLNGEGLEVDQGSSLTLEGGNLWATDAYIGKTGTGSFTHSGGSHTSSNFLSLGGESGSSGTYDLSGTGQLLAYIEHIGLYGTGTFTQSGGTNTITHILSLGTVSTGSGSYELSGTGNLSANNEYIGYCGTGIFTQSGGIHTVANSLVLADQAGSSGTYNLEGGDLSAGSIEVNSGGTFNVTGVGNTLETTVTGNVTNKGTVKTTNAFVIWNGTFTNSGTSGIYNSEQSTQTFTEDLVVEPSGYLVAASQDMFVINEDFENRSTRNDLWDTAQAILQFATGADNSHNLFIPGAEMDDSTEGYENNFAWHSLDLTGQTLYLSDGNAEPGGALYVDEILGVTIKGKEVTNIFGNHLKLNIYYLASSEGNSYLKGKDYELSEGGWLLAIGKVKDKDGRSLDGSSILTGDLILSEGSGNVNFTLGTPNNAAHTPVPASVLLLGSGLLGLGLLGWRRKRSG